MEKKERLYFMDLLKLFAIFCVCYGHCVQHFLTGVPSENAVFRIIYSFHMPLFMVITGYFCYTEKYISLWSATRKKLRQLILPGVSFTLTISLINGFPDAFRRIDYLFPFWFLNCAFICAFLYYSAKCLIPNKLLRGGVSCDIASEPNHYFR